MCTYKYKSINVKPDDEFLIRNRSYFTNIIKIQTFIYLYLLFVYTIIYDY
jgi:hypothetical protein